MYVVLEWIFYPTSSVDIQAELLSLQFFLHLHEPSPDCLQTTIKLLSYQAQEGKSTL